MTWPETVALAQQFETNDGWDLKLYVLGEEVWTVRKPSPVGFSPQGLAISPPLPLPAAELVPSRPEWVELARRCSAIFGLDLFGIDCLETPGGLVVIEVNDFPNYSGVPSIDAKLADYVLSRIAARKDRP